MKSFMILLVLLPMLCHAQGERGYNEGVLRQAGEDVVFSFVVKNSKKMVVLCREPNDKYLVYRFGTKDKIELQYPATLDSSSWKLFKYRGYTRGGGKENLARGEYSLEFTNMNVTYTIHEDWNSEDESYEIGIDIDGADVAVGLKGDPKMHSGDMGFFMGAGELLHNYMGED